jgi:hypothetical protein
VLKEQISRAGAEWLNSSKPVKLPPTQPEVPHLLQQQADIDRRLSQARKVLVDEVVNVFGVKHRHDGIWEIARVPLPPPDGFRRKWVGRPHAHSRSTVCND